MARDTTDQTPLGTLDDMAAYMARVREDYANRRNSGAWGYMVVDALAADRPTEAREVITELDGRAAPDWMSVNHLRPWVHAANGEAVSG